MKSLFQVILAIVAGAVAGALAAMSINSRQQETSSVIKSQRLEIVDTEGHSRAILGVNSKGSAGLQILNKEGQEAVSLGLSNDGKITYLAFKDRGHVLLSTMAHATRGATITLGDQNRSRMIVGAAQSDVDTDEESTDWGLQIRAARSAVPVVSINVHSDLVKGSSDGGILITHPSGKASTFPQTR